MCFGPEKYQTKSFENEYSTFCNFQILYNKSTLIMLSDENFLTLLVYRDVSSIQQICDAPNRKNTF